MLIRECFQDIYKTSSSDEFEILLRMVLCATNRKSDQIKHVAMTIKHHWDGIIHWKDSQINRIQRLNSILQAAKRKARGYKFKHFKTIAFLVTGKLNFNRVNNNLPTHFA